ncbi:membrane protein [Sediminicola sp. YIK13]|uniref:DUF6122 family protein n=1 Tax=Sediminicola sp. YIK13 TaxID=1453352 RepID=UPI00071EFC4A|nr:DUF6122 family protein [Sediminicola sp. YIK13]ALM07502.1 membrane protein [Sediminicola sp. YIK13]
MLRFLMHYGIHFLVPLAIGLYFYKDNRFWAVLILLAGILIDLDHLVASPIFDSTRCSVGFHPLHSYWAIMLYIGFLFFKKTRIVGLALCIHIIADTADCLLM